MTMKICVSRRATSCNATTKARSPRARARKAAEPAPIASRAAQRLIAPRTLGPGIDPLGTRAAPLTNAQANPPPDKPVGVGGTASFNGWISSPERNPALVGTKRQETYQDAVANTPIIAVGVRLGLELCASSKWSFVPPKAYKEDAQALQMGDFIESVSMDMTTAWAQVVRRAARSHYYDHAIQEWTTKKRESDGNVGYADIESRPNHTITQWDMDKSGTVLGWWQRDPNALGEIYYLPRWKCIFTVDQTVVDAPDGQGVLRHTIQTNERLKRYLQLEGYGYEMDLKGIPVGRAPYALIERGKAIFKESGPEAEGAIDPEVADTLVSGLEALVSNHIKNPKQGLMLDSGHYVDTNNGALTQSAVPLWDINVVRGDASSGQAEIHAAIEREKRALAQTLVAEGVMLGDGKGSYALDKSKTSRLVLVINSILAEIASVLYRDFVKPLVELNGWPLDKAPIPVPSDISEKDVVAIANALLALANAGAPIVPGTGDEAPNYVRDLIGAPPYPDAEAAAMLEATRPAPGGAPDGGAADGGGDGGGDQPKEPGARNSEAA